MIQKTRNVLYWSPDSVRYHDAENGLWIDHQHVSDVAAIIWCVANGVEFRKSPARLVSVCEVINTSLKTRTVEKN